MSDSLRQMYQEMILDHSRTPAGRGLIEPTSEHSHEAKEYSPTCGDTVLLRIELEGDVIARVSWEGDGCSISLASLSLLSETVPGLTVEEARALLEHFRTLMHARGQAVEPEVSEALGDLVVFAGVSQFPARVKCAMLGWSALERTLGG